MANVKVDPAEMTRVGKEAGAITDKIRTEAVALANTNFNLRGAAWDGDAMVAGMNFQEGKQAQAMKLVAMLGNTSDATQRGSNVFAGTEQAASAAIRNLPGSVGGSINAPSNPTSV